jgi:hypothetical protein
MLRVLKTERGELDEVAHDESFRLGRSVSGSSGRFPAADSPGTRAGNSVEVEFEPHRSSVEHSDSGVLKQGRHLWRAIYSPALRLTPE